MGMGIVFLYPIITLFINLEEIHYFFNAIFTKLVSLISVFISAFLLHKTLTPYSLADFAEGYDFQILIKQLTSLTGIFFWIFLFLILIIGYRISTIPYGIVYFLFLKKNNKISTAMCALACIFQFIPIVDFWFIVFSRYFIIK